VKSNAELCVALINYLEKAKTIVCLSFEVLLSVPDISFFSRLPKKQHVFIQTSLDYKRGKDDNGG